jgi:hypothetical protein
LVRAGERAAAISAGDGVIRNIMKAMGTLERHAFPFRRAKR